MRRRSPWTTDCAPGTGEWRVIDIIVEGVSLVSSYRSQFQEIMANGGPTRVLKVLEEKNEKAEGQTGEARIGAAASG